MNPITTPTALFVSTVPVLVSLKYTFWPKQTLKRESSDENCWNERWIWEVPLPFFYLVENRELKLEKRMMSLMSVVGLHVSASDEIFSEL